MKPNDDITIYHRIIDPVTRSEVYTRSYVRRVTWEDRKASNVLRSGNIAADQAMIYIPLVRNPVIAVEDVVVRGLVSDEISSTFTVTGLKKKYLGNVLIIHSIDRMDYGATALRHWEVSAG